VIIYLLSTAYEMVHPELSVLMASAELDKRQALNRPPWRALEARNLRIPKFVFATRIFFAIFTLYIVEGDNAPRTRKGASVVDQRGHRYRIYVLKGGGNYARQAYNCACTPVQRCSMSA